MKLSKLKMTSCCRISSLNTCTAALKLFGYLNLKNTDRLKENSICWLRGGSSAWCLNLEICTGENVRTAKMMFIWIRGRCSKLSANLVRKLHAWTVCAHNSVANLLNKMQIQKKSVQHSWSTDFTNVHLVEVGISFIRSFQKCSK